MSYEFWQVARCQLSVSETISPTSWQRQEKETNYFPSNETEIGDRNIPIKCICWAIKLYQEAKTQKSFQPSVRQESSKSNVPSERRGEKKGGCATFQI